MNTFYNFLKRFFDVLCSFFGIVVTLPIWLVAVIGIEISDPGPVFYLAKRVGKGNETFRMYKFRSMRQGKANESVFRGDEDRIFPFGKFIRSTKIDELPQLINILIGDMSIVGPRPAAVDQVAVTRGGEFAVAGNVPAGLTGPSALYDYIYGDSIEDATDYEHLVLPTRLKLDVWYVNNRTALLDIKMIWWTVVCVLASIFKKETPKIYQWLVSKVQDEVVS